MIGKVRAPFDPAVQAFGFIRCEGMAVDYFFHLTDLVDCDAHDVYELDSVEFTPVDPAPTKGARASKVRRIASAATTPAPETAQPAATPGSDS